MHIGIAPKEAETNRIKLRKKAFVLSTIFLIVSLLPFLVYFLFQFHLITSAPRFSKSLEQPVAMVVAGSSMGTGFLVSDKRLITAAHVLKDVSLGGVVDIIFEKAGPVPIKTEARIIWKDSSAHPEPESMLYDVAVLELVRPTDLPEEYPYLVLGNSDNIQSREKVILVGFPGGLFSISAGIIANDKVKDFELFQLDVGAWHGSSGGPLLLEETEEVIGILIAGLTEEFQGINFANKINNVKKLLEQKGVALQ